MKRARFLIVIICVAEAAKFRRNRIVELPDSPYALQPVQRETSRKQFCLRPHTPLQPFDEMPFVDAIVRQINRVRASAQIARRANSHHRAQFGRRGVAKFGGHFQHQIPAHRKTSDENLRHVIFLDQLAHHGANIAAQSGVVKRRRQPFGASAIALV